VLDISRAEGLEGIAAHDDAIGVGPLTTHARLAGSPILLARAPLLAEAASLIGSPQIRNRGTVGGNIMNAATCADTVPPLIALGAEVILRSASGERRMQLKELFAGPYRTVARPDELLTEIRFPAPASRTRSAFIKLGRRNALSIARLSVAVVLRLDEEGRIADPRVVPGSAFPAWERVSEAEEMLAGAIPSRELFAAAGRAAAGAMVARTGRRWSTEYKEPVIAELVRRALELSAAPPRAAEPSAPKRAATGKDESRKPAVRHSNGRNGTPSREETFSATVNGTLRTFQLVPNQTLLELLRDGLGLTGTKCGCEIGECGACTVLLDGEPVNSCLLLAPQIEGKNVRTVEGLMRGEELLPVQKSFVRHDAVHCGFCTPGMLMSATALLDENPAPTDAEAREAVSGNLCRCTGYVQIIEAICSTHNEKTDHDKPTSPARS
jgi:carbon-monoxide dehydrogenase medium subunit